SVRGLLHRGAGPALPAPASPAAARARSRLRTRRPGGRPRARRRRDRQVGGCGLRDAAGGATRDPGVHGDRHRCADLLHLVPRFDHRAETTPGRALSEPAPAIEQVGALPLPLEPRTHDPKVVLVVPAHDEEAVIDVAFAEISKVMDALALEWSIV